MSKRILGFVAILGVFALTSIIPVTNATTIDKAYTIEQIKDSPIQNDFVVSPGKTEMVIKPGETSVKNVTITNRFDHQMRFRLKVEDFTSPDKPGDIIKFLGDEKGPYSLKDFITLDTYEVVLQSGDRANIPVMISIPMDAQPGGLYGAVISSYESMDPLEEMRLKDNEVKGGVSYETRIANLFFIRIPGDVKEEGVLKSFKSNKKWYRSAPVNFNWSYENSGNVYNTPYGVVEITNLYGMMVEQISVDPYYVMPNSERSMVRTWDRGLTIGRYKAKISLNRGYGNQIDTKTVAFWVLPWKVIAIILGGLFLLLVIIRGIRKWFKKNFEYKGGKKKNNTSTNDTPPQS